MQTIFHPLMLDYYTMIHPETTLIRHPTIKRAILVLIIVCWFLPAAGQDCTLKKNKDGIAVYTCNEADSHLKSIRAELTLHDTSPATLINALADVDNFTQWQYKMSEAAVLEHISDREMIYRTVVDAPWPVDNRELIVQMTIDHDPAKGQVFIHVRTVPFNHPATKGLVRVPFSEAKWNITQHDNDLKIIYTLKVDPGGSLPPWIINLGVAEGPFHSFANLRKKVSGPGKATRP
jgi:hypothetical protein